MTEEMVDTGGSAKAARLALSIGLGMGVDIAPPTSRKPLRGPHRPSEQDRQRLEKAEARRRRQRERNLKSMRSSQ